MSLGEIIRNARLEKCLTLRELAEKAMLTKCTIIAIELGRQSPRAKTLLRLCNILDLNYKELIHLI